MKKSRFGDFFISYGYILVILAIVSVVGWYWPINALNQPKENEKISIFIEGYDIVDEELKDDLASHLEDYGVLIVDLYVYAPDDSLINSYYQAFGEYSDILFLTSSSVEEMFNTYPEGAKRDWISYSSSLVNELEISGATYYSYDEEAYGLKIYSKDDEAYNRDISNMITFNSPSFNEDVYIFLRKDSVNFGEYSNNGLTSNGIESLRYILKRYGW